MKKLKLNNKGFSLVELIVAVAVLGIIVVPLLRSFVISQKMQVKATQYTQATLAAENVIKTIEARPVSEFMNLNETSDNALAKKQLLSEMISKGANDITFANGIDSTRIDYMNTLVNEDKEFISVLKGIKSGSSTYDAIVTFDRGYDYDTQNNGTHEQNGIHEINESTIVEYDKMDAVFCQPYIEESNPDQRSDVELKAQAASRFGKEIDEEPDNKSREISIYAYQDLEDDELGKKVQQTITCYVEYKYTYYYNGVKEGNITKNEQISTSYTYAIFPGGYKYDGDLVSIYIMYYPWVDQTSTNSNYKIDTIKVWNNVTRDEYSYTKPLNLSVYLYMQEPETIPASYYYKQEVTYYVPESYEIANEDEDSEDQFNADTLIYTNAANSDITNIDEFHFYVAQGYGWVDRNEHNAKITGDMVKRKPNKLMYNVKVEIFEAGSVTVNSSDNTITVSGDPIYQTVGSKSQN